MYYVPAIISWIPAEKKDMKYEYKIVKHDRLMGEDRLNVYGRDGWRLVSIVYDKGFVSSSSLYYYFIRDRWVEDGKKV